MPVNRISSLGRTVRRVFTSAESSSSSTSTPMPTAEPGFGQHVGQTLDAHDAPDHVVVASWTRPADGAPAPFPPAAPIGPPVLRPLGAPPQSPATSSTIPPLTLPEPAVPLRRPSRPPSPRALRRQALWGTCQGINRAFSLHRPGTQPGCFCEGSNPPPTRPRSPAPPTDLGNPPQRSFGTLCQGQSGHEFPHVAGRVAGCICSDAPPGAPYRPLEPPKRSTHDLIVDGRPVPVATTAFTWFNGPSAVVAESSATASGRLRSRPGPSPTSSSSLSPRAAIFTPATSNPTSNPTSSSSLSPRARSFTPASSGSPDLPVWVAEWVSWAVEFEIQAYTPSDSPSSQLNPEAEVYSPTSESVHSASTLDPRAPAFVAPDSAGEVQETEDQLDAGEEEGEEVIDLRPRRSEIWPF